MSEVDGSLAVNRLRLSAVKLHTLFLRGAMPILLMAMLGGGGDYNYMVYDYDDENIWS